MDTNKLIDWFLHNKRDLPWRKDRNPYHVWVAEVMLQQTRAVVVVDYYLRWLKKFPTLKKLAEAKTEDVIKAWEGLGYYSRVRNLHASAVVVQNNFDGMIPSTKEELRKLKGLGPYTIGAILSFGFNQKSVAIDANVMRVLTRIYCVEEDISKKATQKKLENLQEDNLNSSKPWVIIEAMIELGAMVCKKKPKCEICPIKNQCKALLQKKELALPNKPGKADQIEVYRGVVIVQHKDKLLLWKGEKHKILQDLYQFPHFDFLTKKTTSQREISHWIEEKWGVKSCFVKKLSEHIQFYTKYKIHLFPYVFSASDSFEGQWFSKKDANQLPFSSAHRKILEKL